MEDFPGENFLVYSTEQIVKLKYVTENKVSAVKGKLDFPNNDSFDGQRENLFPSSW